MELRAVNFVILAAVGALFLASGTQHEHAVISDGKTDTMRTLEADYGTKGDATALSALVQGYLDAQAPGLAISAVENASPALQSTPKVQHVYARALVEAGRTNEALAAEQRVLDACAATDGVCDSWLVASATRRSDIMRQMVSLGIEDAQAYPEASAIAYASATREARLVSR
ncbi:hypothetical protein BH09MYX1_BH09MYX1_24400 [soil metagenome]